MSDINVSNGSERRPDRRAAGRFLGLILAACAGVLGACDLADEALEVEVPGQITSDQTFAPDQAPVLVNSAIAHIECGLSDFIAMNGAGNADAFHRTIGWWNGSMEYEATPDTDECSTGENQYGWFTPIHSGRWLAEQTYQRLNEEWTAEQVPNRQQLMATAAIYIGLAYTHLGEHFCEVTTNTGPLMAWNEALGSGVEGVDGAEVWLTRAIDTHIPGAGGDFAIEPGITDSALTLAYLLRARARLARGDVSDAASDANQVPMGYRANITRESGGEGQRRRFNRVFSSQNQAQWSTLIGPIDFWVGGTNPVTGDSWPAVIPFTGYWNLGVLPDGRAVSDTGHPITTTDEPTAVPDTRVPAMPTGDQLEFQGGYPEWNQQKYTGLGDDFALAKWQEAWLIRAEAAGTAAEAISLVDAIRTAEGLPTVTYIDGSATDDEIENMIIEEIRRTHFLEGRFWAAKLRHIDKTWFPRGTGSALQFNYNTGVRMVMPENEYDLNPNLELTDQGRMCPQYQNPQI